MAQRRIWHGMRGRRTSFTTLFHVLDFADLHPVSMNKASNALFFSNLLINSSIAIGLSSRSKILQCSRWVLHSGGWVAPPYPLLIWSFQYPFSWCRLNAHAILKCNCFIYLFNWHLHLVRYLKHYIFFNRVFSTHLLCHCVAPPKMLYQYFGILHISGILLMNSYNI